MKSDSFSQNRWWLLGIAILLSLFLMDSVWSQDGQRDRRGRQRNRRGDPTSFLRVVRDEQFAATLNLTAEQKTQFEKLRMEGMGLGEKIQNRDELVQALKELDDRAVALLDDTQKAVWQKRKDEIVAEQAKADANSGDKAATNPSTSANPTAPTAAPVNAPTGGVVTVESSKPAGRTAIPVETIPEGAIAVASFAPSSASAVTAVTPNEKPEGHSKLESSPKEEANLSFNFRYAAWDTVLKKFAEANDLSLDLNDVPPGTFNYLDNQRYTMTEALDVVNGYLLSKGYVLVRRDRFLVCLNIIDNPIPPNVVPNVTEEELLSRGKNELLSLVLPLEGLDAEKMVAEVKELLGPQGKVSALKSTNSLVMTDIGSNLRRVSQLLKSSKPIDNRETAFKAIPMKNISAADAERIVRRHFGLNPVVTSTPAAPAFGQFGGRGGMGPGGFGGFQGRGGGGGGGGDGNPQNPIPAQPAAPTNSNPSPFAGKIQVTADTRGNYLLVTASAAMIKVVEELVKNLDSDTDSKGGKVQTKDSPVYFQGYSVSGGDATSLSRMLNNIVPGVVVGEDARAGKIYVQGTKEEHAEIQRLLKASSDTSSTTSVFQLIARDPAQMANSLRNLFINDAPRAPTIEPDASGRKLMVRGTTDQLNQVRSFLRDLKELAETSGGGVDLNGNALPEVDRGNVRRLNLGGHDPDEVLDLVKSTWGASGQSPIRIVFPSKPSPIRDRRIPGALPPIEERRSDEFEPAEPRRRGGVRPETEKSGRLDRIDPNEDRLNERQPPREIQPVPRIRTTSTQILPRRSEVVQTNQVATDESPRKGRGFVQVRTLADAPREPEFPQNLFLNPAANIAVNDAQAGSESTNADEKEIGVTIMGNDIILTSPDTKSLDRLEDMITAMVAALPTRTRWTVFYLRSADATESAQMIEKLFPQSAVTTSGTGSDSFFGSFAGGLSSLSRGVMNATGLNQTLGGAQSLKVITDVRANALFVTGPRDVIRDIEYVLELLDSTDLPGTMRERVPRTIPVEYADIDEVAGIIESVFKDSMTPENPQQGQQGMNPFAMMFGGNRGAAAQPAKKPSSVDLTLGVDKRTSHLIVSCNETMFRRIETMVQDLDQRAKEAHPTVRLVPMKTADPAVVAATLTSLMPRVTVGTTKAKASKKQGENSTPGQPQPNQPADPGRDAQFIQRMMQPNNPQPGGGQTGGGQGGGRFGRGGGGGGGNGRGGRGNGGN